MEAAPAATTPAGARTRLQAAGGRPPNGAFFVEFSDGDGAGVFLQYKVCFVTHQAAESR